jgi:hypothetical protein
VLVTVWWSGCWSRRPIRTERVRRVAHGWNIDSAVGSDASDFSTPGDRLERVGVELPAGARCWVLRDQASRRRGSRSHRKRCGCESAGWWGLGLDGPSLGCMKLEGYLWGSVVPIVC